MQMHMILLMMIMITMMMIYCSSGPPGAGKGEECGTEQRCPHNCKCARGELSPCIAATSYIWWLLCMRINVFEHHCVWRLSCMRVIILSYENYHAARLQVCKRWPSVIYEDHHIILIVDWKWCLKKGCMDWIGLDLLLGMVSPPL